MNKWKSGDTIFLKLGISRAFTTTAVLLVNLLTTNLCTANRTTE
jgi:hypothetical protein